MNNHENQEENEIPSGDAVDGGASVSLGENLEVQHAGPDFIGDADYEAFLRLVPSDVPPARRSEKEWIDDLIYAQKDGFSYVDPHTQNNVYLMSRYSERLRGIFILNEFSQRKMVVKCPPWQREEKFKPRDVRDDDYARVLSELEHLHLRPKIGQVTAAVESICHDRSFHPVQRFFKNLKWDGVKRVGKWLPYYMGAEKDPFEYLEAVGSKWLVAAVARIYNPGCKFDHMLVLEGGTDIGKSAALRKLATFHGEEYFYDGMTFGIIHDKDTMQKIQGNIIIEFPELSSLQARDVDDVKQWITIQEDRGRKPYGREPVMYPRQFVLAGTTNNSEYLRDSTGNKRFWPVRCGDRLALKSLEDDREQLWAEAVHLYESGFCYWIPEGDPLIPVFQECQNSRLVRHSWEEDIMNFCEGKSFITTRDILVKAIDMQLHKIRRGDEMIVADILKMNGFRAKRTGKLRGWEPKKTQEQFNYSGDENV